MIYDYVVIFSFKDGYFKYRKQTETDTQAQQIVELVWQDHVNQMKQLNEAYPETADILMDFAKVEGVEVIALHTIPWKGKPV